MTDSRQPSNSRHRYDRDAPPTAGADVDEEPTDSRPLLYLDVDGVISLFGFPDAAVAPGRFHFVDGVAHCIDPGCGRLLERLLDRFEIVWATGWEEKANEYLPHLLELPGLELPALTFEGRARFGSAHWKVDAIDEHAGHRPAAWIDDNLDETCRSWAEQRSAPTLLVETEPATGISEPHVEDLIAWADQVTGGSYRRDAPAPPLSGT